MTIAEQYAADVVEGNIVACEFVQLACRRYFDDRERCIERGLYFKEDLAKRAISFIQRLPQTKGKWAGERLTLEPWEQFIIWNLFGWMRADGTRRFRKAYIEVARKNGKTTLLAAIQLYMLYADKEPRAEVYSVATTRDQAKISFDEAVSMVQKSKLRTELQVWKKSITDESTGSTMQALSSEAKTLEGHSPSCAGVDEFHAHTDSSVYDVMINGMGARRQPLIVIITTAGINQSGPCYAYRKAMSGILHGTIVDDSTFAIIYTLDDEAEFDNPKMWIKSNPNMGVSVGIDFLAEQYNTAKTQPEKYTDILIKNFNVWTHGDHVWLKDETWMTNKTTTDIAELDGQECWGGIDLSNVNDITALVLLFHLHDRFQILSFSWLPEATMIDKVRKDNINYDVWARQGYVKITPGNVVDYEFIEAEIHTLRERYNIKRLDYDRYNATQPVLRLQADGLECVPFGQGFVSMSAPTKRLQQLALTNQLEHFDNPCLRWQISNVAIQQDAAGNIKIDKNKSGEKVDNVVALVMALGAFMTDEGAPNEDNPYATRGLLK